MWSLARSLKEGKNPLLATTLPIQLGVLTLGLVLIGGGPGSKASAQTIRVDTAHSTNSFRPNETLGAGIDRIPTESTDKLFTPDTIKEILSAGWQTVTYRQNTELHVEAWHWNPEGKWSDPAGQGYFTGSATPTQMIRHSHGYPLTHAGFSHPDGGSYSRLTDGDTETYWKSNPYLSKEFSGEDD